MKEEFGSAEEIAVLRKIIAESTPTNAGVGQSKLGPMPTKEQMAMTGRPFTFEAYVPTGGFDLSLCFVCLFQ